MLFMIMFTIVNPIIMLFMKHPMSMGLTLLIQTMMICLITGMMNYNFWLSYILFLIMIGGMLILFTYMTSVASNEKFKFSIKIMMLMMILLMLIMYMYLTINESMMINLFNKENFLLNYNFNFNLNKFLSFPLNMMLFLMIIYLLISLIAIVKIINMNIGPLRQLN